MTREEKLAAKKAKLKEKKQQRRMAAADYRSDLEQRPAAMTPPELSEWLWARFTRHRGGKGNVIEQDMFTAARLAGLPDAGAALAKRVQAAADAGGWAAALREDKGPKGAPTVLVVASAAVAANQAAKVLGPLSPKCRPAKLFARHFKAEEQVAWLKENRCQVAAGTPNRLLRLCEDDALRLSRVRLVLLHVARDAKQRTLFDMPETSTDFWKLFVTHLAPQMAREGGARLAAFDDEL
ncbi:unnamed protein product [Pedinophyceae sp. YPF-701]|nr:unnamed protein product [Pedinophyceae sp. YPF-701]